MTLGDISSGYNVTLNEIAAEFNLPMEQVTPDKAVKDLESETFSVTKLRDWLKARQASAP
jgi:antitoxin component of RelBE/YafQ-DinJ toxin-antitoxin module